MEDPFAEIKSVVLKVIATLTRRSTGRIHESRYGFQASLLFHSSGTKFEEQSYEPVREEKSSNVPLNSQT